MRRLTCLARLSRSFGGRIHRLEYIAASTAGNSGPNVDRAVAFITIEAQTTWANFSREFYLSCALLSPKTIAGRRVFHTTSNILDERHALLRSIQVLKPNRYAGAARSVNISPRDEPTWHEKVCLLRMAQDLHLSNQAMIIAGLSYPTTFFNDLPVIRNFYAHRSHKSVEKVRELARRNYGIRSLVHPTELVNQTLSGGTQTLLSEWLGDMRTISDTLCN